jgi:hypothetical protein
VILTRGLHSFRFQLKLSSSVHRVTQLNPECVLELLTSSAKVNEGKLLILTGLGGYPPFWRFDDNQRKLFDHIISNDWSFDQPCWGEISDEAKELVKGLMVGRCKLTP